VKLLLDENISPRAALALRAAGVDAVHVRERGLLEATDVEVLERAYKEDRVLVTLNVGDFLQLARRRELHAGIVVIEQAGLLRDEQIELVRRIDAALSTQVDMINRVLRVSLDGAMMFEELPK
jgi:predicted nuclease of predicted toxin-antitoxin system